MNDEPIRDIGQILVCLAILAIAGYIQITQGQLPAPWDTLILAVIAVLGLADGVRLVVRHRYNNRNRSTHKENNRHDKSNRH